LTTSNTPDNNTNFFITFSATGTLSFNWNYVTNAGLLQGLRPFGYTINGNFTQLTTNFGSINQSGSVSITVNAGDVFGFRQRIGVFGGLGSATTTITNFRAPVPGPISALALLPLAGVAAYRRRYKSLIKS
jgi:hypothetical protein